MCICPDSPWVIEANNFIQNDENRGTAEWHTVNFLLDHCGLDNRIDIHSILEYLRQNGIDLDREEFQQNALGDLKGRGIVATLPYPGPRGGVFIPCNDNEVITVAQQILDRVRSEIENLEGVAQHTDFPNLFVDIRGAITRARDQLQ